ncbi:MAG: type VI secretion system tube protein Hcp [Desulfatitalea sp.]|nr:type VI secretion system tube protein Hcp [Desulfatitalea sp.]NNK01037.1 type VI secretion system tube protein Hcp [Desulfatitalea sp.]
MAFDAFVRIDGIDGESGDDRHPNWIEVITFETGLNQNISTTASSAGGASAERADFKGFIFTKLLDIASPKLALACAAGTHIDHVVLELCRSGGDKLMYMEYKMSNCLISRFNVAGGPGEFPAEWISINFGKIQWRYVVQRRKGGGAAGQMVTGWNLERNCRL